VQGSVDAAKPGWLTFGQKILLALLGVIFLMAGILLIVIQRETSIQIATAIDDAVSKSRNNFQELEKTWKSELNSLCKRYTNSPRILGAFDAALEDSDPSVLAEAANYETKLAATSGYLILFFNPEGRVMCALVDGRLEDGAKGNPGQIQSVPQEDESFGYTIYDGQLYAAHTDSLSFFSRKLGYILIGLPLREEVVQHLGERVNGQVCFVVGSRAIVTTSGIAQSSLLHQMEALSGHEESRSLTFSGQTWALFSEYLNPQKTGEGSMVYAIPLGKILAPFQRIRTILLWAALSTMVAAVILGFFLSKGLSAPILALVDGTEKVAQGNYDFQVNITSRDELGTLGKAFNNMVHDLFLKEKYRDVLNKVVSPEIAEEMLKGNLYLGGEDRVVTTLFADIRGFTSMTEGMDPREAIAMLNEVLEGTSAAVEAEGGVVDKYAGDQIMAIFGAPLHHSDDAMRAVRTALRMQETIRKLNESRLASGKPEIAIGIGINTGLVVAGNVGTKTRLNYTVLGETVNLADRLCSTAKAGEILLSVSTLHAVGPLLDAQALNPVSLKGLSVPVPIWLVKGLKTS
jgi:class 3 adenylate cyclase/HAMP domain-containing protein